MQNLVPGKKKILGFEFFAFLAILSGNVHVYFPAEIISKIDVVHFVQNWDRISYRNILLNCDTNQQKILNITFCIPLHLSGNANVLFSW